MPMQPLTTILVKKSDGTSVRMSMEEFRVYKNSNLAPVKIKKIDDVKLLETKPEPKSEILPATSAPVTKIFVDEAMSRNKLPIKKSDLLIKILKNIKFPVKEELFTRIESLAISKAKDVRSDEQILEYMLRAEKIGGLGFNQKQAEELLLAIKNSLVITAKAKVFDSKIEPAVNLAPSQNFFLNKEKNVVKDFGNKPVMHDVLPVQKVVEEKVSVGPVDEIRNFTLVDFRRLGSNPKERIKVLQEKLDALRSDSIISFLEAVSAWRESLLFSEYEKVLSDAILGGKKVVEEVSVHNQLSWEEFTELVDFNNRMSF